MTGEMNLKKLLKNLKPVLNAGSYVFVSVESIVGIDRNAVICEFKEQEGTTLVLEQKEADNLGLPYNFIASWITLNVHSSLHAVGLTAAVSTLLTKNNISCNCIAGYYHDHLFVVEKHGVKAIDLLISMSNDIAD